MGGCHFSFLAKNLWYYHNQKLHLTNSSKYETFLAGQLLELKKTVKCKKDLF